MEASQHSLLAACFTLHSINATLATVPQRGAELWIVTSQGNRHLIATEYVTKWPEAYAIPNQEASTAAEKLVTNFYCF
jgi:hypothetical protein